MKRVLLTNLVFLIVCAQSAQAKMVRADDGSKPFIKVAVIDTGLSSELYSREEYCKTGHRDFTMKEPEIPIKPTIMQLGKYLNDKEAYEHPKDDHGHGTHISGLIDQYAKNIIMKAGGPRDQAIKLGEAKANYCQIIIKYYDSKGSDINNLVNTIKAFRWAIDQDVDIINYSGGGIMPNEAEKTVVLEALNKGIKVVAAAGNERSDVDIRAYYPAMYDKRIYIVGNGVSGDSQIRAPSSNFGKSVTNWEDGKDSLSRLLNGQFGFMTGTSQSTAIKSGKLVRELLNAK